MIPQRIMRPSSGHAIEQLDPQCSQQTYQAQSATWGLHPVAYKLLLTAPTHGGMARLSWPGCLCLPGYILRWFTCPQLVVHPSTWPGVKSDAITITVPSHVMHYSVHTVHTHAPLVIRQCNLFWYWLKATMFCSCQVYTESVALLWPHLVRFPFWNIFIAVCSVL